jgi:hypothetical protein
MPGVKGILTADDLPAPPKDAGAGAAPSLRPEAALTRSRSTEASDSGDRGR